MRFLSLALIACVGENPARSEIDRRNAAIEAPRPAGDWTCPMHPEVSAHEPGPCPKCGMPVVERGK